MLEFEVFIRKFCAVNRFTTSTVVVSKITTLNHEIWDNAVKGTALVEQRCASVSATLDFAFLAGSSKSDRLQSNSFEHRNMRF